MAIQPTDLGASVAKSADRDIAQQARQGAPTGDEQASLNQLAEAARKQVRQKDHLQRVEPRRDANQDGGRGRGKRGAQRRPNENELEDEEHHFDALA
jgi:hypothetical protein